METDFKKRSLWNLPEKYEANNTGTSKANDSTKKNQKTRDFTKKTNSCDRRWVGAMLHHQHNAYFIGRRIFMELNGPTGWNTWPSAFQLKYMFL